jgi:peptidoglycan/xylan/chitin deacetylase (PgdA/CDA1 family)
MTSRGRPYRRRVIALIVVAVLVLIAVKVVRTLLRPSDWVLDAVSTYYPGVVFRVDTKERAIALTIDDSPHPDVTPGLLRELRTAGVHATFFVIGANAEAYPDLVDSIRTNGHELANHLYTDRMSAGLPDEEFVVELLLTDALIRPAGPVKWCRPGSGCLTPRIVRLLNENGYTPCVGTAYPVDLIATVEWTVAHFLENVRPGAILVLHDGQSSRQDNVQVLADLLPRLSEMGYRQTTLTELSRLGEPVVDETDQ